MTDLGKMNPKAVEKPNKENKSMAKKVKVSGHFRTTHGKRVYIRAQVRATVNTVAVSACASGSEKPGAKKPATKKPAKKKLKRKKA